MQTITLEGTEIKDFKLYFGVLELEQIEKYHKMELGAFFNTYGNGLTAKITSLWAGVSRFQPEYSSAQGREKIALMIDAFFSSGGTMDPITEKLTLALSEGGLGNGARGAEKN